MKILLAHNNFHITGGAEVFYHEVGRVLEQNGHEVAYFSVQDKKNPSTKWEKYFPETVNYNEGSLIGRILSFKNMVYSKNSKKKFKKLLLDFKPDLVHTFSVNIKLTPSILDACCEENIPVIMSCNDYKHICPNYKLFRNGHLCEDCKGGHFYNAAIHRCSKNSIVFSLAGSIEAYVHNFMNIYRKNINTFLFASEFMAHKTEEFWGKDTFKWQILKNPFNSRGYSIQNEYSDYILYFGRLIDEKGVDVLIKAMQDCPSVRLKIIGDGPDMNILKDMVQRLKLKNIEFLGPKWGVDLNNILYKARFVVVPSIWHENFPYVILQSFAVGKAVVGSNLGGIPELVRHNEFGYIYPALDSKELANYINILWSDPSLAVEMGKKAKEWNDNEFNDEKFYKNIMRIYTGLLQ